MSKWSIIRRFICLLPLVLLLACASSKEKKQPSLEEQWEKAYKLFSKGNYREAIPELTIITFNFPASQLADDAQFYLGECHFEETEYILAISEYQRLINLFPQSPLVQEALFKLGYCYYLQSPDYSHDQSNTVLFIDAFQEFIDEYPKDPRGIRVLKWMEEGRLKLAKKKYQSAELYYRLKEFKAAIVYYDLVIDLYYDTEFARQAILKKTRCYMRMEKWKEAEAWINTAMKKQKDAEILKKMRKLLEETVEKRKLSSS